ncbi:MAG: transglutaminase-like domain-containing protein [Bacteroidota bacterium]
MPVQVIDKEVADGDEAVDYTVRGPMCGLAVRDSSNPCIVALARRLKAASHTDEEAIRRAFLHVVETIPFRRDPDEYELVVAPKYTLGCEKPSPGYKPHGDCDCQSTALAALLIAMGYEPRFRVVAWRRWDFTHVNVQVYLPGRKPIPLDAVMRYAGWNNEKPPNYREKIYSCPLPMKVRALADNVGGRNPGCGCAACRARGLADCGCRSRGRSCCSRNGAPNGSPVTVNVNSGRIDSRRFIDSSERLDVDTDSSSRWVQFPSRTTERQVIREVPKTLRVSVPPPIIQPILRQRVQAQPTIIHAIRPDPPLRRWKEFT